jgi:hypothetical protein
VGRSRQNWLTWLRAGVIAAVVAACAPAAPAAAPEPPAHPPRYDLDITLDTHAHRTQVRERVTWTNTSARAADQLVFNFYPHYRVPEGDYLLLAKMLELLRMHPSQGIDRGGRHGVIAEVRLIAGNGSPLARPEALPFEIDADSPTTMRVPLPRPVNPGEAVTVELDFTIHLPNKQGRWGQWDGVTFLTNALPQLAAHDDAGWHPVPYIPWAQPWFADASVFTATFTMPEAEALACSAPVKSEARLGDGWKRVETEPFLGRDFAFLCSARYREFRLDAKLPDGRVLPLKCLAFPEHEFYATEMLKIVAEALPTFTDWFGPFPHPQFTIAESFFGWNGNECSGLVMIDQRVFGMPHVGRNYVDYLVSHEFCHQWWYDLVGTNGYAEPFVDEGAAVFFTHRLMDLKHGKNSTLFTWPRELDWLPNVRRQDYRYGSMYAAIRNGQMQPAAQDLPRYGHVYGLFTGAYDRGSKVYGMIEDRLGEAAFLDFIRLLVAKYGWRTLRAADLKRELEAYTGRDWTEFFDRWVYGKGITDWEVRSVAVENEAPLLARQLPLTGAVGNRHTTVILRQNREFTEPTVLGIRFKGQQGYPVRIAIDPAAGPVRVPIPLMHAPGRKEDEVAVEPQPDGTVRVTFVTFADLEQIAVDPDGVLLDADPGNNCWRPEPRVRVTPLYTMLDETSLTSAQDRWNFTAGPWIWGATYPDPWYTRATMAGLRVGAVRPQHFQGGAYAAYRTDYRDLVFGVDGLWQWTMQQTGFNYERRIGGPFGDQDGAGGPQRASVFHRWVLKQTASMYLPPMVYHETFLDYQDNFLPFARNSVPGAERWDRAWTWGWHFRANLYTPYWDPEGGWWTDLVAGVGQVRLPGWTTTGQLRAELAGVQQLPDGLGPLSTFRVAGRVVGMGALPDRGMFFPLGGGTLFRGYDLAERQGSALWVGNFELRMPVVRGVEWDTLDHCVGLRNAWVAAFYDVGDVYANGRSVGGVAHALGAGLRLDVAMFSFIERATLRFDAAKTVNDNTPFQFWFGMQHAF